MKRVLFAVALLLLIQVIGYCQDQPLQLTIKSDKQVYEVGEEIKINLTLKNIGKENITIIKRTGYQHTDLIIDGLDRHGRLDQKYGENHPLIAYFYIYPAEDDFLILKPNEHWNTTIHVFESIEAEIIKELLKETGRHTISVLYYIDDAQVKNASELGFQLSTLRLVSNPITIEVVKKKSAQPLQLTIKSDKQVYKVGVPISIKLILTNISQKPIYIVTGFLEESYSISFIIKDEKRELFYLSPLVDWIHGLPKEAITKLIAGGSVERSYILPQTEYYKKPDLGNTNKQYIPAKEGKYIIQAEYSNFEDAPESYGFKLWKGKIISNELPIEVVAGK